MPTPFNREVGILFFSLSAFVEVLLVLSGIIFIYRATAPWLFRAQRPTEPRLHRFILQSV
ncbi:MAG: hypothetical protein K6A32_05340 [Bacteroidales bacterium]|nr:hypothetical protein [Bacteroidales bacterium]